jgi:hypothetical protein
MKIYEFAAIFLPKERKDEKIAEKAAIIVQPTTILAKDEKEAMLKAARALPEDYVDKLDQVEICVRPF